MIENVLMGYMVCDRCGLHGSPSAESSAEVRARAMADEGWIYLSMRDLCPSCGAETAAEAELAREVGVEGSAQHLPSVWGDLCLWDEDKSVADLPLRTATKNTLRRYQVATVRDALSLTGSDFGLMFGFGRESVRDLHQTLFGEGVDVSDPPADEVGLSPEEAP